MSTYTQGPWKILTATSHSRGVFGGPHDSLIATVQSGAGLNVPTEIDANAHLIAAAPDLFDACRAFVEWYNVDSTEQKRDDAFYAAQAALAKAEGRS